MQDKTLTCRDCGKEFVFTVGEQEFYQQKGFDQEPTRCPECRQAHKNARRSGGFGGEKKSYDITCSNCGKPGTVPFEPKGDRPVLCRDCFAQERGN